MTNTKPYSDIGPFKLAPEAARIRIAAAANLASDRAYDAALRAASKEEGKAFIDGVHPSSAAVASVWDEEKESKTARDSLHLSVLMSVPYWAIFLMVGAACILGRICDKNAPLTLGIGSFGIGLVLLIASYIIGYRKAFRMLREIKANGFADDEMLDALAEAATNVWLFGDQAIYIAEPAEDRTPKVRTVFYDAIGTATVTVENGVEGVTITTRDGQTIARIAKPEGRDVTSADGLVARIKQAVDKSRKVA
jgi:hypothetical protein